MTLDEDKVKWPSKKRFACKKGQGEHEYLEPTIKYKPQVRYIYDAGDGTLYSGKLENDETYLRTEVSIVLETTCKNCGHKCLSFLTDKIK